MLQDETDFDKTPYWNQSNQVSKKMIFEVENNLENFKTHTSSTCFNIAIIEERWEEFYRG